MTKQNNQKKNVIWNMIFSVLNAAQSAILLYFVNLICREERAGIFSFAFSIAVLFMYIGNYGIRNFQVSDTKERYRPSQYYAFRMVTLLAMVICVAIYILSRFAMPPISNAGNNSSEKMLVIIALCLTRLAECLEDVFHGRYQQQNALYLAGMQGTVRILFANLAFVLILMINHNLVWASMVMAIASWVCVVFFAIVTIRQFGGFALDFSGKGMKSMMLECFPLFTGYFLITYLGNVTKYALERYESNSLQTYFNMIFMPVFVINLLSTMIFRPIIGTMAENYNHGKIKEYQKLIQKQNGMIAIIAVLIITICYFIGIPTLSWFYKTDLSEYQIPFLILLLGGTLSAYSSFLNVCIITIRGQKKMLIATLLTAVVSYGITYKSLAYFVQRPDLLKQWNHIFPSLESLHLGVASTAFFISMLLQLILYILIHTAMLKKVLRYKGERG
ncbi:MAG TPA: oligosaccharide flippase family protein [Lachnospiraceae bacterium]|nr:oligosaccharide flippase family protein [Lachnospiraceae bacterium]HPF30208.1 oligosaccharide flippase family protein [Lachnospiraceae bacterium]